MRTVTAQFEGNLDFVSEIGVVVPTYCEAENIGRLIVEVENLGLDASILVIDDSSPDGTSGIVKALQKEHPNILLLTRPLKRGLGTAIIDGFRLFLSTKKPPQFIITMDADYSHNPQKIPQLVESSRGKRNLTVGSRYCNGGRVAGWSFTRRIVSRVANLVAKSILGLKPQDCTSGFRCYPTNFLRTIIGNLHSTTYEIQIETLKQAHLKGFGTEEVPILFVNRKKGKSKLSITEIRDFLLYIFRTITLS